MFFDFACVTLQLGFMKREHSTYRTPFMLLLFVMMCVFCTQSSKDNDALCADISLNTKAVVSHFSHTCSASAISGTEDKEGRKETELAIKENRTLAFDTNNTDYDIEDNYVGKNYSAILSSYKQSKANNLISCKTLHQLNVLII